MIYGKVEKIKVVHVQYWCNYFSNILLVWNLQIRNYFRILSMEFFQHLCVYVTLMHVCPVTCGGQKSTLQVVLRNNVVWIFFISLLGETGWPVHFRGHLVSTPPFLGLQACATTLESFAWILGQTQVLVLTRQLVKLCKPSPSPAKIIL